MRVRLLGVYDTNYQQCNGRFAPTSHGRYKDSRSEKEMIVVKLRTPTDYENRRYSGNFL